MPLNYAPTRHARRLFVICSRPPSLPLLEPDLGLRLTSLPLPLFPRNVVPSIHPNVDVGTVVVVASDFNAQMLASRTRNLNLSFRAQAQVNLQEVAFKALLVQRVLE